MEAHAPVLLNEVLLNLNLKANSVVVDLTLGRGGHSSAILKQIPRGKLIAFDQDIEAIKSSKDRLAVISSNYTLIHDNFTTLEKHLTKLGIPKVDAILLDLGVSSPQFDEAERGFSYRYDGPLDMRMDQINNPLTAEIVVNTYSAERLMKLFYEYAEHKYSRRIATNIVKAREAQPITSTLRLVEVIKASLPNSELRKKGHPAKTIFQALRIEVNDELGSLKEVLDAALESLAVDGRLAVITFHSLEDRIVKQKMKEVSSVKSDKHLPFKLPSVEDEPKFSLITRKVITATDEELADNPRAQSAKLRIITRRRE